MDGKRGGVNSDKLRLAVAATAVVAVFLTAAVWKRRAAQRLIPEARRMLPAGSSLVVSVSSAPAIRAADPQAAVASGPPKMFHLDPARRNRSPFRGPANPTITSVTELQDPIQTAPAVLPDGTVVVGTLGGNVVGIREDGQISFTTRLGDRVYSSPLVIGERVFLGTDDDRFVAMSSRGNVLWSLATEGDADTAGTPTSDHGILFAAHDTVYFVRKDGTVVWRVRAKRKVFSSPAITEDGTVFVGAQDNRLYGIRRTGTVGFALDLGNDVDCAPGIDDDGTVFVGTDGGAVVAVEGDIGKEKWRTQVGGHVRGGVTVTRSHVVVAGVYGPSPRVVSLRGDTGEVLWSFAVPGTGAREFGVHGSPVEDADGNLYFGAQDDAVYAITANGKLRWKLATGGDVDAPIVLLADGVLLAASDDGKLYRIEDRCDDGD